MKLGEFITFVELQNKLTKSFTTLTTSIHDYNTTNKDENAIYRVSRLVVSNGHHEAQIIYSVSTVNDKPTFKMMNCDIFFAEDWLTTRSLFIKNAKMSDIVNQILE